MYEILEIKVGKNRKTLQLKNNFGSFPSNEERKKLNNGFKIRTVQTVSHENDAIPTRFKNFTTHLKKVNITNIIVMPSRSQKSGNHYLLHWHPQYHEQNKVQTSEIPTVETSASLEVPEPAVQHEGPPPKKLCLEAAQPVVTSPGKMQKQLEKSNTTILPLKKKLKQSQQKSRRLKKKVTDLKGVVKQLRKQNLISSKCEEMLDQTFSWVPLPLIKRMTSEKSGKGNKYSPELKSFALTLFLYSAKAYEFVMKTLNVALPSHSQIRRWYRKVAVDPGFTWPAFNALKVKAENAQKNGKKIICTLMLDEMAIRKHILCLEMVKRFKVMLILAMALMMIPYLWQQMH